MKSNCCNAEVRVESGDEGTSHYACNKCGNACDLKIEDGGPAFPTFEEANVKGQVVVSRQTGMTLRDYFAAKAMQSMMIDLNYKTQSYVDEVAKYAYVAADVMLKEREK